MDPLFEALRLPCGATLPNRLAKASMEENLCDADHAPGEALVRLYGAWARGGAGLLLTGNVMIDRRALTGPGGVVLEDDRFLPRFAAWAKAMRSEGAQAWMQINHPGRQVMASMGQPAVAPSAVPLSMAGMEKMFARPRALEEPEIREVIERFVRTSLLAERAGFTGVQIHAAHGYLLSQFLSPLANRRSDGWGGSLRARARLLLEVVAAVKARVAAGFCVAVKLNSADFQRGGFETGDAIQVVQWLEQAGVDLVELSGGSYESPAMRGLSADERTLAREAYFLDVAREIRKATKVPLMLTGGIRRRSVAEKVLADGIDVVGMATSLACVPDLPNRWRAGEDVVAPEVFVGWRRKPLAAAATMAVVKSQLDRLSNGRAPRPGLSPVGALVCSQWQSHRKARLYRDWMQQGAKATLA